MKYILEGDIKDITNSMLQYKEALRNNTTHADVERGEMYIVIGYSVEVNYDKYGVHDFENDDMDITDRYRIDYKYYYVNGDQSDIITYYHNTFEQIDYIDHIVMG